MLSAEACLLTAIRDHLRAQLSLQPEQCDVEFDNEVPAIAGDWYYAIVPAGVTMGPRHSTSGGAWDYKIATRVVVYRRLAGRPRDRKSDIFLDLYSDIANALDRVIDQLDFNYQLMANAAQLFTGTMAADGEFPEPFKRVDPDRSFEPIYNEPYAAAQMRSEMGDPVLAVRRGVTFSDCRFMKVR